MKIWKLWTKFKNPRDGWSYHADVALEGGEELQVIFPGNDIKKIMCPPHSELKIHMEVCTESFEKEE